MYGVDCPDEKIDILNSLILECIERHAPTRKSKVMRPPAPWLQNLDMINLQKCKKELRYLVHRTKSDQDWQNYRNIRNRIKAEIKSTKKAFYKTALSSKKPSEVWRCINKILHPNPNRINADPNVLNSHLNSTAPRLLNSTPSTTSELLTPADILPFTTQCFEIQHVTYHDVLKEIKSLRLDCSSGYDNIPIILIRPVAESIASTLTHIINNGIDANLFHKALKN